MARTSRQTRSRSRTTRNLRPGGERVLPWILLAQATEIVRERPQDLSPDHRLRLRELVARSGGRGINLSPRERAEVSLLVARANAAPKRPAVAVPLVASRRRRAIG
jgi:hypothetical protein